MDGPNCTLSSCPGVRGVDDAHHCVAVGSGQVCALQSEGGGHAVPTSIGVPTVAAFDAGVMVSNGESLQLLETKQDGSGACNIGVGELRAEGSTVSKGAGESNCASKAFISCSSLLTSSSVKEVKGGNGGDALFVG